ncbi:MAG: DUF4190 domain-containing protein [Bacteroidia bacterium]
MRSIRPLFFLLLAVILLHSCSVTQRRYMPGYSISWNKQNNETGKATLPSENTDAQQFTTNEELPLTASADYIPSTPKPGFIHNPKRKTFDECDIITLKNGTEVRAKVLEINPTEIKYKKCDNVDGPTIIINKSDASKIKYSNGITEIIHEPVPAEEADYYSPGEKTNKPVAKNTPYGGNFNKTLNPFALASFISAILSIVFIVLAIVYSPLLLVFVPASIVLGIIALKEINANPKLYKGKGLATFGIIFGAVVTSIVLIFLALFLLLLALI